MSYKADPEKMNNAALGILPNPVKLFRALLRPAQPFVMINMLTFKTQATGEYSHLSGEDAYMLYARSVEKSQAPLGSRLLWAGKVHQKETQGISPEFQTIALLEYASPKAFIQFVTKGGSETRARSVGLEGQWLIASTTVQEGKLPDTEKGIVLVELIGGLKRNPAAVEKWHRVKGLDYPEVGAKTIWYGRCDHHILGLASPGIEEVLVTWFPSVESVDRVMNDVQRQDFVSTLNPYVLYSAFTKPHLLPELR